jgi:hypothetical protein
MMEMYIFEVILIMKGFNLKGDCNLVSQILFYKICHEVAIQQSF